MRGTCTGSPPPARKGHFASVIAAGILRAAGSASPVVAASLPRERATASSPERRQRREVRLPLRHGLTEQVLRVKDDP